MRKMLIVVVSGGVVLAAVIGLVWGSVSSAGRSPSAAVSSASAEKKSAPTPVASSSAPPAATPVPSSSPSRPPSSGVVDPTVVDRGLVPEPITTDPVAYGIAAARALVSFDATRISRDQFAQYISSWFGNDPRYGKNSAVLRDTRARKADVVFDRIIGDTERWNTLAIDKSVLTAVHTGAVKLDGDHVEPTPEEIRSLVKAGFHLVTVELNVTTTGLQGTQPMSITDPLRVTMQINCRKSLPVGDTPQITGDCKIIQYMAEPSL
ncbi:MAG: hypothetical protein ACRCSP_02295 [Rhodoglobus sp.]